MQTVLILGADGFIGKSLFAYLSARSKGQFSLTGTRFYFNDPALDFLDMRIKQDVASYFEKTRPDFVILLSGTKDVKQCETDFTYAQTLNTQPVLDIIDIIERRRLETRVLYFSSDYVFDGARGFYAPHDQPNPGTRYGQSKLLSETALLNSVIDFKIIRTSAVMGQGANFFDWLVHALRHEKEINLFNNVYFTPTPQCFLNEIMYEVLLQYSAIQNPILHLVGEERLTRYELACFIKECIPDGPARIRGEEADLTHSTFQKDLSMLQSEFVRTFQTADFYTYLKRELS